MVGGGSGPFGLHSDGSGAFGPDSDGAAATGARFAVSRDCLVALALGEDLERLVLDGGPTGCGVGSLGGVGVWIALPAGESSLVT